MKEYLEDGALHEKVAATDNRHAVLLIGDSIRQGYCHAAKEALSDIADVRFPADNCRCTQYTYISLQNWLGLFPEQKPEVILWNNGHWDVAHWGGDTEPLNSIHVYVDMTLRIAKRLHKMCPNAKLIFATTTPMNPSGIVGGNPRTTAEIASYNEAVTAALAALPFVTIDDHFTFCKDWGSELFKDYCHLTTDGFTMLGHHVADTIRKAL